MKLIYLIGLGVFIFYIAWVHYLAIMNLKVNKEYLSERVKKLAKPVVFIGSLSNVLFNFTVAIVLFRERPHEWFFTHRCQRHQRESSGWRLQRANWWCANILNPFDVKRVHC